METYCSLRGPDYSKWSGPQKSNATDWFLKGEPFKADTKHKQMHMVLTALISFPR